VFTFKFVTVIETTVLTVQTKFQRTGKWSGQLQVWKPGVLFQEVFGCWFTWSPFLLRDLEIFLSCTLLGDKLAWFMKLRQWQGL